jgi:hypothetical protein
MTPTPPERNNPGYTPEYKELEEARESATSLCKSNQLIEHGAKHASIFALRWLAAEVRVMRLERALER